MSFGYHNADSVQNKLTFHACFFPQIQMNLPFSGIKCHLDICSLGRKCILQLFSICPSLFAGMCWFWPSGHKVGRRETFSSILSKMLSVGQDEFGWDECWKHEMAGDAWVSWLYSFLSLFASHCPPLPWREHPRTFSVAGLGTSLSQIAVQVMGLEG